VAVLSVILIVTEELGLKCMCWCVQDGDHVLLDEVRFGSACFMLC
jgi:hypothetical protein